MSNHISQYITLPQLVAILNSHLSTLVQVLKLMYHAPATAGYHQSTWANIGRHVNPLVQRYAPFMHAPISSIQGWWLR